MDQYNILHNDVESDGFVGKYMALAKVHMVKILVALVVIVVLVVVYKLFLAEGLTAGSAMSKYQERDNFMPQWACQGEAKPDYGCAEDDELCGYMQEAAHDGTESFANARGQFSDDQLRQKLHN